MDYFQLTCSLNDSEIGYLPQIEKGICKLDPEDPLFSANNMFRQVELIPVTPTLVLHADAKLTDLISSSVIGAYGMLMSERLRKIVIRFRKDGWQFFPVSVICETGKTLTYWLPNPYDFDFRHLDFQQTAMSIMGKYGNKVTDYSPKSVSELVSMIGFLKYPQKVSIDHPVFIPDLDDDVILLRYVYDQPALYVSERVKEMIIRESCTGISFVRLEQPAESFKK